MAPLSPQLEAVVAAALGELPGAEPWRGAVLARAGALQQALREGDERRAIVAAVALCGLGEGSTPAGDDYLVGALHALWRRQRPALAMTIAAACEGRTTTTSAAWLSAAAAGEASPVWRTLLAALDGGDASAVGAAAQAVRRTGHTSGAFSLRGFLDTLAALPPG